MIVLTALIVIGCQENSLENSLSGDGRMIRYSVVSDMVSVTKAFDELAVPSSVLSDKSGAVAIPLSLEVSQGITYASAVSRGKLVNTTDEDKPLSSFESIAGSFVVKAYSGEVEKVSQTVTWSGSAWVAEPATSWPRSSSLNFLAYSNLPEGQTATIAATGVSMSYTEPDDATEQTDMMFGHYQGDGGSTGTAAMRFDHPLTAVSFLYGDIDGNPGIKSISLDGVAAGGTVTKTPDGTVSWSGVSVYNLTVSQSATSGLDVDGTTHLIGEPFIIIPQNLEDNNVEVTVEFTDGTVVSATLNSGEWKAGYTNTYTLGYDDEWEYFIEGMNPVVISYLGGYEDMSVKSYKKNSITGEIKPLSWSLEYSADGENWSSVKPDWLSITAGSVIGGNTGESLTVNVAAQNGVDGGSKPVKEKHDANLKNAVPKGTQTDRYDLSYFNVATGKETSLRSTANTYVVSASGYYKIPLVYGNAIKNGVTNSQAYMAPEPTGPGTFTHYLRQFVNHGNKPVSDPWIKNGLNANGSTIGTGGLNACVVWQDADNLVSNVKIDGDYLAFDVNSSSITQGNCVVAVRNSGNDILWSWQIWVTDEDLSDVEGVTISGKNYNFRKVLLGWYSTGDAPVTSYASRSCHIRANNGHVTSGSAVTQLQFEDVALSTKGSCTMYQWGRKDPFPGGDGNFSNKWRGIYQKSYDVVFCAPGRLEFKSIGSAIQSPYYMNAQYEYFWDWNDVCYTNFWNAPVSISDEDIAIKGHDYDQYKSIETTKTIYDPSPVGFKIPNGQAYEGIVSRESGSYRYDSNSRGFIYESASGSIFFPCCGYRNAAMMCSYSDNFWYNTSGFALWSSTTSHTQTGFMMQYDPDDSNCAGQKLTTSNSNRPYALAVALVTE